MDSTLQFFATTARGTEGVLRDELRALRLPNVRAERGGVNFSGTLRDGAVACLWSRIAMRVLLRVADFDARDAQELYAGVDTVDWSNFLTSRHTLAVRATTVQSALHHTQFIAQKTKDAIVDQMRAHGNARPDVNRDDPDVHVTVHVHRDRAAVLLDLGGAPMHLRGYRTSNVNAPVKETLAAAILRLAGWRGDTPLVDPMCGSGTFAIEAAMVSENVAPGILRPTFGFERWAHLAKSARTWMAELRAEAKAARRPAETLIAGSDHDADAIRVARAGAGRAGVRVNFTLADAATLVPTEPPGTLVVNPPYGERLSATDESMHALSTVVERWTRAGWTAHVLAGAPVVRRAVDRRPSREHELWNGPIECRLLTYGPTSA